MTYNRGLTSSSYNNSYTTRTTRTTIEGGDTYTSSPGFGYGTSGDAYVSSPSYSYDDGNNYNNGNTYASSPSYEYDNSNNYIGNDGSNIISNNINGNENIVNNGIFPGGGSGYSGGRCNRGFGQGGGSGIRELLQQLISMLSGSGNPGGFSLGY